jgi:ABC-type polysaccharide/polyol phosphate transport system ATPase subunit
MLSNGPSPYAVQLQGVSKRYLLDPTHPWGVKDVFLRPQRIVRKINEKEPFWALKDITLDVPHGQILGVIGPNGSGKSSLLRVLAGISPPTRGSVTIHGRYGALLELGAGFHANVTGRENAYLNALFMGMSKEEARAALPSIIDFSELGPFIDQPMRTYSSGMYLRLGFAVAIHVRPDILLVDEVLAVGDAEFQEKCFEHFRTLKANRTTVILVTHNIDTLVDFADRVIMLERGEIRLDGPPLDVVGEYMKVILRGAPALEGALRRAVSGRLVDQAIQKGIPFEAIEAAARQLEQRRS